MMPLLGLYVSSPDSPQALNGFGCAHVKGLVGGKVKARRRLATVCMPRRLNDLHGCGA